MPSVSSLAALVALHLLAAPDEAKDLVTAAASSTRPPECAARGEAGRTPSVWERARVPRRAIYCRAIAEAHARLATDPGGATAAMERAEAAWPDRAATRVVAARLALARGDTKAALTAFDAALGLDPRAVSDPATLRDHARALARGGRGAEALAQYRALAPQAALLTLSSRAESLVEAGLVSMGTVVPAAEEIVMLRTGEALALLREARSLGATPIAGETALVYALALDRVGDALGARRELAEASRLGASMERLRPLVADAADAIALAALLAEATDRARAAAEWDRYLSAPGSATYRGAAEKRREALRGGERTQAGSRAPRPKGGARAPRSPAPKNDR